MITRAAGASTGTTLHVDRAAERTSRPSHSADVEHLAMTGTALVVEIERMTHRAERTAGAGTRPTGARPAAERVGIR